MSKGCVTRIAGWVVLMLVGATAASAQWVMVGRMVVGKVTTMTQPRDDKTSGYDAATVILNAEAAKVYAKSLELLQKNPEVTLARKNDAKLTLAFKHGEWTSQMTVTPLGENLCQVLIASSAGPGQPSGTSVVLQHIESVCDQFGVKYSLEAP